MTLFCIISTLVLLTHLYMYTCIHVYMCTYVCIRVNCVLGYFAESQMLVWKVPGLARGHRHCLGGCRNRRGVHCRGRDGNTPRGNLLYMFDVCDLLHMTKDSFSNYLYCMLVKPLPPWPRFLTWCKTNTLPNICRSPDLQIPNSLTKIWRGSIFG